jgi:hypothetical protein
VYDCTLFGLSRVKLFSDSIVFLIADFLALVIQAVGGAKAAMALTNEGAEDGAKIMLVGIGIQFASLSIYALLAAEFLFRVRTDRPVRDNSLLERYVIDRKIKTMIIALCISALFLFLRWFECFVMWTMCLLIVTL